MLNLNIMIFTVFFALMLIKDFFQKYKKKQNNLTNPKLEILCAFRIDN